MLTRRQLLVRGVKGATAAILLPTTGRAERSSVWVNDVHSQLNRTPVSGIVRPESVDGLAQVVRDAAARGQRLCTAGGRHAMGGQQFARDALLLDMNGLDAVVAFDAREGLIEAGAGIQWPALVRHLLEAQRGADGAWGIAQKQTGADRLSLGGALAANAHGRGLRMQPISGDVDSFTLVETSK